jgi:predicted RNase H-like HicB family nuclease
MSINEMKVSFDLALATRLDEETGVHVGYCPALNVYSQGRSSEEAVEAVASAVTLFIGACFERGILHGLLRDKGFTLSVSSA